MPGAFAVWPDARLIPPPKKIKTLSPAVPMVVLSLDCVDFQINILCTLQHPGCNDDNINNVDNEMCYKNVCCHIPCKREGDSSFSVLFQAV